jgi:polysaccharide biosynthesis protein PslG
MMKKTLLAIVLGFLVCASAFAEPNAAAKKKAKAKPHAYPNVTWNKFKASGPDLKQIGWIATKESKDIASSTWSVGCETLDRDYAKFSVYKKYVGQLGVKHARLQSGWAKTEKKKGVYDFAWLDECVYGLDEQKVKPWICLCYGNPIYKSTIDLGAGLGAVVRNKETMDAWLKYVESIVTHYKDVVTEWEIWNEPFGQEKDYAALLIPTAEIIKKIQPNAVILVTEYGGTKPVLDELKTQNKLDLFDFWVYHPYSPNPDRGDGERLKKLVESFNPKYRIYQGEAGCPSQLEWAHALANYPWTEYSQAKWDLRRMASDHMRGIPTSVFTITDLQYTFMLQSFGLIRSNTLHQFIYKRPSFYAVKHMAGFFDDTVKTIGPLEHNADTKRKTTVAGFQKDGKSIVLVWYNDNVPTDDLKWDPVDLAIQGATFQDPVYVEMITGKVFDLPKDSWKAEADGASFTKLSIWDSPVMIAERSLVEMTRDVND